MADRARADTKLTYQDYLLFPDDGNRHEIIDGDHYMSPSPSTDHQTVSRWIQFQLFEQIEKTGTGRVFNAPTAVELTETDVVEPDLVVVAWARREIITRPRILGIPDLLVEIISPQRPQYDRDLKFRLYQRTGVPEYWIVETEARAVDRFRLGKGGTYAAAERRTERIEFASGAMGASVDLAQVWKAVAGL